MADIVQATYTYLQTVTAVTALVSTRIRPDVLDPKETLPAIVLSEISSIPDQSLGGSVGGGQARIQADCYAIKPSDAVELRQQVRLAMINHGSNKGRHTALGSEVATGITVGTMFSWREQATDGSEAWRYVRTIDFLIGHKEAIV